MSGPRSNGNEDVLRIPQRSSIIESSPSECFVLYQDTRWGSLTALQRCCQCILQPQPMEPSRLLWQTLVQHRCPSLGLHITTQWRVLQDNRWLCKLKVFITVYRQRIPTSPIKGSVQVSKGSMLDLSSPVLISDFWVNFF